MQSSSSLPAIPARRFRSEIARRCGIPKPTAHKILGALHASGWVSRSPLNLRYGLGPTLILIGHAASEVRPEVNLARPVMEDFVTQFRCECMLSTAVSDEILISNPPAQSCAWVDVSDRRSDAAKSRPLVHASSCGGRRTNGTSGMHGVASAMRSLREQMDAILHVTVERGYVVTLHTDFQDQVAEAVRLMPKDLTAQQIRVFLTQRLASLSQVAYLGGGIAGRQGACMVESLQAPVFDVDGMPRYDLALVIHREFEPEALDRIGRRLRAAADGVSARIPTERRPPWPLERADPGHLTGTSPPLSSSRRCVLAERGRPHRAVGALWGQDRLPAPAPA